MSIGPLRIFERISTQEKINFARHLAIVIKAGLPLLEGLKIVRKQETSRTLARVVDGLLLDVNNGQFLAASLEKYGHLFDDFFTNIVRVGESSGTLAQNLLYLAEELRKAKELHAKIRSAMIYPAIILIATIALTGFLAFFIFPQLLPVFEGLSVQLPASTRLLITIVNLIRLYGIQALVVAVLLVVAVRVFLMRITAVKYFFDAAGLFMPVMSSLAINVSMVNFTRVLGILLKSGVRIHEALGITAKTFDNLVYRRRIHDAQDKIQKGGQLSASLALHRRLFPSLLVGMIQVGENTGNLEENLFYLSEYYDEETDERLRNLTSLLEPMLLLIMGFAVGFVAISIITPIYSISQGIK